MLFSSRNDVSLGNCTSQRNRHIKMVMASHLGHLNEMEIEHTHTLESIIQGAAGAGVSRIFTELYNGLHYLIQEQFYHPPKRSPLYLATAPILPFPWSLRTVTPLCGSACPECSLRTG